MDGEERLSVLDKHQSLAEGTHPDQIKVGLVNSIRFTNIKLSEDGLGAKATLFLDDLKIRNVTISRDEAGTAKFSLPGISFRLITYRAWFLPENVEAAILQLADQILPPAKPLGRDPATGMIITAQNPASDRIRAEDLSRAVELFSNESIGTGVRL
jgi:hypothetical protein